MRTVITLSWMRPDDMAFIGSLAREAFADYDLAAETHVRVRIAAPGRLVLMARWAGERAGFAVLTAHAGALLLEAIAVAPEYRGRGVGRRLVAGVEEAARRRGAAAITLTTAAANVAAIELFLRAGFAVERRHSRAYRGREPALEMRKVLVARPR